MKRIMAALSLLLLAPTAARAGETALSDYWPSLDGLRWDFSQFYQEVHPQPLTTTNNAQFTFSGTCEVPGGIETQRLALEVLPQPDASSTAALATLPADPFLRRLWMARPDLRSRLLPLSTAAQCAELVQTQGFNQLMLHQAAYRKTPQEIGAWRTNAQSLQSWLWLTDNLSPGSTFMLQLVPDLANDVWLHGTVIGLADVTVPAGSYPGCLQVDYLIDYGVTTCLDEQLFQSGSYRGKTTGSIYFAPGVGPVKTTEEYVQYSEILTGTCPDAVVGEVWSRGSLNLLTTPVVPVVGMTWGGIKARFSDR